MPSDEYSSFGKGALKLKGGGGKVKKHKKKKDKGSDLQKALSTGEASGERRDSDAGADQLEKRTKSRSPVEADDDDGDDSVVRQKTEAERRFEEAKRKKVGDFPLQTRLFRHGSYTDAPCPAFGDVQVRGRAA